MDAMTPEQRHRAMAHARGRTRLERALARALWKRGLRYLTDTGYKARYGKALPGHPDLVFPRKCVVVFVDGCFWHGCPQCGGVPQKSGEFWRRKIENNVERDRRVTAELRADGWAVIRVPGHDLKKKILLEQNADKLAEQLLSRAPAKGARQRSPRRGFACSS